MSDKTKRLRDDAEQRRRFDEVAARDAAKPDLTPRCLCGLTYRETQIMAVDQGRWKPTAYYCRICAPANIKALCWP